MEPPPEPESEQSAGHQIELYMLNGAQRWCDVAAVLQCAASCAVSALLSEGSARNPICAADSTYSSLGGRSHRFGTSSTGRGLATLTTVWLARVPIILSARLCRD